MLHPRVRLQFIVSVILIISAFIGVVLTQIQSHGAWKYWRYVSIFFAAISMWLTWHLHVMGWKERATTIWHELAHWAGVILCIQMIAFFVHIGLESRYLGSITALLILSLGTYLAGVNMEVSYVVVGIVLALFSAALAFFAEYMYAILIPLKIGAQNKRHYS